MVKSKNKKMNDIKNKKKDNSKRENPNRGKHGCYRLHQMRAEREQQQNMLEVQKSDQLKEENVKISTGKGLWGKFNKIKRMFKR